MGGRARYFGCYRSLSMTGFGREGAISVIPVGHNTGHNLFSIKYYRTIFDVNYCLRIVIG